MDIQIYIEHLQEMGRVALQGNENIRKLKKELLGAGYRTKFESTDRDYLVLTDWGGKREGAGRPATDRKGRLIRLNDKEYEKVKEFIKELRKSE
ncbi:MAG: hypothetical protein Q8880_06350 [Bacteroidota bacterium]|nr:hypothetical protein [Bacteroidota bacterium]